MEIFSWHEGLQKYVEVGNSGMFRPEVKHARPHFLFLEAVIVVCARVCGIHLDLCVCALN